MHYVWLFCVFTALGLALKGISAVQWKLGMLQSVRTNLATALINKIVFPVVFASLVGMGQSLLPETGIPHVSTEFWAAMPVVSVLAYVVMRDFLDYWTHRLMHTSLIWPIHAVHHSDPDMNWTTSYRIHLLEGVLMRTSYLIMPVLTGIPPIGVLTGFLIFQVYNCFVHTDADIHFGPLTRVFSTPRFHKWHHADMPEAYNTNFGGVLSLWDVLFGTYRVPGPYEGKYGFEGTPGNSFSMLLIWPFLEWGRMVRRWLARRQAATDVQLDQAQA